MINKKLTLIMLSLSISNLCLGDDDIRWIAQDYAPYSYIDSNGNKAGLAVEIAKEIMKKIGSKQTADDIDIKIFSKYFIRMNDNPNTVFFPFLQVPEREKYFKWVGPIAMNQPVIIARTQKQIKVNNLADLNQYSIGAKEGYNAVAMLTNLGVNGSVFQTATSDEEDLTRLKTGAVDMVVCDEMSCNAAMAKLGMSKDCEVIYRMQSSKFSFAFSKDTSDDIINQVQQALNEMKTSKAGTISDYDKIMKKYVVKE